MSFNVLFLCTGNSARSILAEAILDRVGAPHFHGYSAGSHPKGEVNPYALDLLRRLDYDVSRLRSKSWDEFAAPAAPEMDFVITVCDDAAGEVCPVWPGRPAKMHWGLPDPAATQGAPSEIGQAFDQTYRTLESRIGLFVKLKMRHADIVRSE